MKKPTRFIALSALIFVALFISACTSTKSQNGVTIEKKRNLNPLNYIPDIPGININ
ncbi:MAG: hypothetical protein AAF065_11580 [Verrucomicrobiota bacterium]